MAVPMTDGLLVPWSTNFNMRANATPEDFGLLPAQATAYTPLHSAYLVAYTALTSARAEGTQSKSLKQARDAAKEELLAYARELYAFVQANTSVTDANKTLLGVHVRSHGLTPAPAPDVAPGTDIAGVSGRKLTVHIHDSASSSKRGKPAHVKAAWVYSFVGAEYPSNPALWQFEGAANKGKFEINFPETVAEGAQVWVCAAWVNGKNEPGPASVPITARLQYGGVDASTTLKIAA